MSEWQPVETMPEGKILLTKIHDHKGERNVQRLVRQGNLFFIPDRSMYVYFSPTHWRHEVRVSVISPETGRAIVYSEEEYAKKMALVAAWQRALETAVEIPKFPKEQEKKQRV